MKCLMCEAEIAISAGQGRICPNGCRSAVVSDKAPAAVWMTVSHAEFEKACQKALDLNNGRQTIENLKKELGLVEKRSQSGA
jgi:hypothetical protein